MKITKFGLIAVLASGLLASGSALAQETNGPGKSGKRGGGFPTVEQRLDRMSTSLNLTADQKPKVKAALEEQDKTLRGARDLPREERGTKFRESRDAFDKKLKDILTPDQYKKWEETRPMGKKKKSE